MAHSPLIAPPSREFVQSCTAGVMRRAQLAASQQASNVLGGADTRGDAAFEQDILSLSSALSSESVGSGADAPPSMLLGSPEARQALQVLHQAGLAAPTVNEVHAAKDAVCDSPAHADLVAQSRDALLARGAAPSSGRWARAMGGGRLLGHGNVARNVTAYVFFVMLEAQREATQEKRDALRAMKMHAGMLEDLNLWLGRVVLPAQRALNAKIKAGNLRDSLNKRSKHTLDGRDSRIEEVVGVPDEVDTTWGAIDGASGRVYIPALQPNAVTPTKLDAQDLTALIAQTDQWRTTLQNQQNKESMEFKRLDDAMSSTWQQLSAFLKSAQDGANAIIRNGVG